MYKINNHTYARGMQALSNGKPTKQVKSQKCYILCHQAGHPLKTKGQFHVYSSRWKALVANVANKYLIKRLIIEL